MVLLFSLVLFSLISFYQTNRMYLYPAWCYWGVASLGFTSSDFWGSFTLTQQTLYLVVQFLLPFCSALAYSYCHYDNRRSGVIKALLPRCGVSSYYRSGGLSSFLGGFLIIFLPLVLEQLILLIAFPASMDINTASSPIVDNLPEMLRIPVYLYALQVNHPYLFNLLYCLIPGLTGGLLAYSSYTFSLFFQKSRFVVLSAVGIFLWIILPFGALRTEALVDTIGSFFTLWPGRDPLWWLFIFSGLLLVNIGLTELKIHKMKDELS